MESHCLTYIITLSLTEGDNMNLARTGLVEEAMLGKVLLMVFLGDGKEEQFYDPRQEHNIEVLLPAGPHY